MHKIYTITGKIGSGKSTLMNSIKNSMIERYSLCNKYINNNDAFDLYIDNENEQSLKVLFINIDKFNKHLISNNAETLCNLLNCNKFELENSIKNYVLNKDEIFLTNYKLLFSTYFKKCLSEYTSYFYKSKVIIFLESGYNLLETQELLLSVFPFYQKRFIFMKTHNDIIINNVQYRDKRNIDETKEILSLQNSDEEYETLADHIYISKQNNDILSLKDEVNFVKYKEFKHIDFNINSDFELERFFTNDLYKYLNK